ncbi:hypothetical protein FQN52_004733 [Onygenales sp. PD_12]|nr:hypothetical protein FQN52_004733 [Onygenales sp. PD_12]
MARHRHEASLEGLSNFSTPEPLPPSVRARAKQGFYSIIHHFRGDMVLRAFFDAMGLDMQVGNIDFDHDGDQLRENRASFAEFLMVNFSYRVLKASSNRTTQPSPAQFSAAQRAQGSPHESIGA